MARYLLKWGIPSQEHYQKEYEAESEQDASSEAQTEAMGLVYWSHERLDLLSAEEIEMLAYKVRSAFAELPIEHQKTMVNSLSQFVANSYRHATD